MPPVAPGQAATHWTIGQFATPRHVPSRTADPSSLSFTARLASECYLAEWSVLRQLKNSLCYSPTVQPDPSVLHLCFEFDACGMALGSFAAQNSYLKRDSRLPLDQAAYHDFTDSCLCLVNVFVPYAAHSPPVSYATEIPFIPLFCITETSQHSCLPVTICSLDTDFTRNGRRLHTGPALPGGGFI